jgi:hypothetical protein
LERVWIGEEANEEEKKAEIGRRKQLLKSRMNDVGLSSPSTES